MSRFAVGVRAQRALYVVGAFVLALSMAVVASAKADAAPTTASWYGPGFAGSPTASGEIFNPQALTAAHKSLPFGTQVEVCYNGCATVTVNDRGPYIAGREYDLSQGAAQAIGLGGVGTVDATVLGQGGEASEPAPVENESDGVSAAAQARPASTEGGSYGETYTVQDGDTLFSIAQDNGVSVDEIADANDISNVDLIFPGQEFSIPGDTAA